MRFRAPTDDRRRPRSAGGRTLSCSRKLVVARTTSCSFSGAIGFSTNAFAPNWSLRSTSASAFDDVNTTTGTRFAFAWRWNSRSTPRPSTLGLAQVEEDPGGGVGGVGPVAAEVVQGLVAVGHRHDIGIGGGPDRLHHQGTVHAVVLDQENPGSHPATVPPGRRPSTPVTTGGSADPTRRACRGAVGPVRLPRPVRRRPGRRPRGPPTGPWRARRACRAAPRRRSWWPAPRRGC